ncbi:MAG TPA: FAD-dependent oxidoreductase [Jatrophihabitans sp.]|nr:FAD-dependent oxidoreductase [Jatrophihabitans sp.]
MSESDGFVIVGGGLAGAKAAEALREQGYDGPLILVAAEQHLPYERPGLSKDFLVGSAERDSLFVHDGQWYADHHLDLRTGIEASAIDRNARQLQLSDGSSLGYRKLLLATGSRPRPLPVTGADAANVYQLRTIADAERLQELFSRIERLLVVGAGWIGLEVSAAARKAGVAVTVVESAELPLLPVLGRELAQVYAQLHRSHGVDFRFGASLERFEVDGDRVTSAELADGSSIVTDAVLVAIGAQPNVELAQSAGLAVDDGILVNSALLTADPDIVACGDVANAMHPFYNKRIRVEHWATALKQPAVAARTMRGEATSYDELPYFYSDQYDLGMEFVGHLEPGGYDEVVYRGDLAAHEFVAFWLAGGRVVAGMNVNVWDVADAVKALIRKGTVIDQRLLTNPDIPLNQQ